MMKPSTKLEKRVAVQLPVQVSIDNKQENHRLTTQGTVNDLSINGMKISVPLPFGMIDETNFDIDMDLPNPFSKIKGRGKVKWKTWDDKNNCVQCGLELEPMTLKQLADLDCIVDELSDAK